MQYKHDTSLQEKAEDVFSQLINTPLNIKDIDCITSLVHEGLDSSSWHHKSHTLRMLSSLYYRHILIMSKPQKSTLHNLAVEMLFDSRVEVRQQATVVLAGMMRCSLAEDGGDLAKRLKDRFMDDLSRDQGPHAPSDMRRGALLGLGAVVTAVTYITPIPSWVPPVLIKVANTNYNRAYEKVAERIIYEFKLERRETWKLDLMVSTILPASVNSN